MCRCWKVFQMNVLNHFIMFHPIFRVFWSLQSQSHVICSGFIFYLLFLSLEVLENFLKAESDGFAMSALFQSLSSVWNQPHRLPGARGWSSLTLGLHTFYCQYSPNCKLKCNPSLPRNGGNRLTCSERHVCAEQERHGVSTSFFIFLSLHLLIY